MTRPTRKASRRRREQEPRAVPFDSPVEVEIESLAGGGAGVGKVGGRVLFVAGGVPGDRLLVEITEAHRRFMRGRILSILSPSLSRREIVCPFGDVCGGCPWMGMEIGLQQVSKEELVRETLARIGGVSRDLVQSLIPSPLELGYRNRIRLWVEGVSVGFRRTGSRRVVDVSRCAVAMPSLNLALDRIREHVKGHLPLSEPLQIELHHDDEDVLHLAVSGRTAAIFKDAEALLAHLVSGRTGGICAVRTILDASSLEWRGVPRLGFSQANPAQNRAMVVHVGYALALEKQQRMLDLYAGAGNFSLPQAGKVREVLGVEANADAVAIANQRSPANAAYVAGDAVDVLKRLIVQGERFDCVVLDPPRAGAAEVCVLLPQLGAENVAYVSCDPATLARDLKGLIASGFDLEGVTPFDLLPNTAHVECVAILRRRH